MKDPAFLFYSSDFLTGTMTMDNEQVGKYIRLLCLQHQKKRLTKKDMLKICETYDKDIFDKFIQNEDGFFNERMEEEMVKRSKYSESRRKNREGKGKKEDNICKSYVPHMENENENINVINKEWYEIKDQLINRKSDWFEKLAIDNNISVDIVRKLLLTFISNMEADDNIYKPLSEYLSYFRNWLAKNKEVPTEDRRAKILKLQKQQDEKLEKQRKIVEAEWANEKK